MPDLTLVTGYWPQKHDHIRTADVYVRLFDELVRHVDGRIPIVVRPDPSIEAATREIASRWPNSVLVEPLAVEELAYDRAKYKDLQPAENCQPVRDTIEYATLVWSKPQTVLSVAEKNPFKTRHFGWIDFGIAHVAELLDVDWRAVEKACTATTKIRLCERMATAPHEVEDPYYFYSTNSARMCGGLITGTKDTLGELAAIFETEIARMAETGSYALEEQVLAAATALRPDLFDNWYGCYYGVLTNVTGLRRDVPMVLENLRHCADAELWDKGCHVARYVLRSGEEYFHLIPEQCFELLDAGLICALRSDRTLAEQLGKTAISLFHYSRVGRGMMRGMWRKSLNDSLKEIDLSFSMRPWTWEEFTNQPSFRVWLSCF